MSLLIIKLAQKSPLFENISWQDLTNQNRMCLQFPITSSANLENGVSHPVYQGWLIFFGSTTGFVSHIWCGNVIPVRSVTTSLSYMDPHHTHLHTEQRHMCRIHPPAGDTKTRIPPADPCIRWGWVYYALPIHQMTREGHWAGWSFFEILFPPPKSAGVLGKPEQFAYKSDRAPEVGRAAIPAPHDLNPAQLRFWNRSLCVNSCMFGSTILAWQACWVNRCQEKRLIDITAPIPIDVCVVPKDARSRATGVHDAGGRAMECSPILTVGKCVSGLLNRICITAQVAMQSPVVL